jgi:3-oxoacyl-[acyl-carrier protein] reductase
MSKLANKVAIVTGASKGIGAGIAKALAAAGAAVVVNYAASREGADLVVGEISKAGGKALAVQGDVAKATDLRRVFAETKEAFGRFDILVNNASIYEFGPLESVTEEQFHRHFNINVLGLLLASQEAARHFGPEGGTIINIGTVNSQVITPNSVLYAATKGAVDTITRVLARELGPKGIRVNSINPGPVETEGTRSGGLLESELVAEFKRNTPLGNRIGQPEDIAPITVFLASEDSHWLTGEILLASGGLR